MPIEFKCPGCNRVLRVSDESAGQKSRCPVCRTTATVPTPKKTAPGASDTTSANEDAELRVEPDWKDPPQAPVAPVEPKFDTAGTRWRVRTPSGEEYGPVDRGDLETWIGEGRLTSDCEIAEEGSSLWQRASTMFANLPHSQTSVSGSSSHSNPSAGASAVNPYSSSSYTASNPYSGSVSPTRYLKAERGALVLTLGILGVVFLAICTPVCWVLAPMAWIMGQNDLADMRSGAMDPTGMGTTQAGMIMGIIGSVISLITCVCIVPLLFLG